MFLRGQHKTAMALNTRNVTREPAQSQFTNLDPTPATGPWPPLTFIGDLAVTRARH